MRPGPELTVDPTLLTSWLRVRPDNTVAIQTGVGDFGQGAVGTNFRQIVAEELRLPFEAITEVVAGDTDRTPDGGIAAGVMSKATQEHFMNGVGIHPDSPFGRSALNLQKAAAYAYAALLDRASEVLGGSVEELTATGGTVRFRARSVTYAELVRDSPLDVRLEVVGSRDGFGVFVLGEPPIVPVSEYRVIGTSCPNPRIPNIVQETLQWVGSVTLPGMLHARMIHPPTLGSTLVSTGTLNADQYPHAQVVVQGNMVAVVAPDEWEAIRASEALATTTVWTDWSGLPRSDDLVEALAETDWTRVPVTASSDDAAGPDAAFHSASYRLNAFFTLPFYKHAPISPEITVADVRNDGSAHVWTCSQKLRALQTKIAARLDRDVEAVVVHFADGAGGFGRTTRGDAGPEIEAVILSQACGHPVRLQWMREEDFAWSTQQAPYFGEVSIGLDDDRRMVAFIAEHRSPGTHDAPLLGEALAGLAVEHAESEALYTNQLWVEWPYDRVPHHLERAYGAPNIGEGASPLGVGLTHRSMRSPGHLQQNFAVECMVNEAAAVAAVDPIQFRIDHTTDDRFIGVLETVREMSAWDRRHSPAPLARATGSGIVRGRGVGATIRHGGYFAGVAEIAVDLDSGAVTVERYWIAVDVGVVVNPRLLKLNVEGATIMGLSQALHEELHFNRSAITSTDFRSYPILTMAEVPEIEVEVIPRPDAMVVGQASEPPNMVPPVALAGAFFDATGRHIRRMPMRPAYVVGELRDS